MIWRNVANEMKAIFQKWPIWSMLGTQDIKMRYRRSSIGPLWITISMAVTIYSMGFLYGHLFKLALAHYFPFLAAGIIGWALISGLILESSNAFIESELYIKNQETFMSLFIARIVLRNFIVFAHNLIVFIPIIFFFHMAFSVKTLLLIPGLFLIATNAIFYGTFLGIIGTRYRDFSQIITSLVQVIFFLTPIMWMPTLLPARLQWVVMFNPFNQFLNLIRAPLLNEPIGLVTTLSVLIVTLFGFFLYAYFLGKFKHKIVFWL